MSAQTKKCAHPACYCPVDDHTKYCSEYCHDSGGRTEITCNCHHAACEVGANIPAMSAS